MNEEFNRLDKVAKLRFKSLYNIAKLIGIKSQSLYSYKDRIGFGKHMLSKFESIGINPRYIQHGEDPMFLNETEKPSIVSEPIGEYNMDLSNLFEIEVYDMPANANIGSLVSFYDLPVSVKKLSLSMKLESANLKGVRIIGDSMKEAYIRSGGIAIYDTKSSPINGDVVVCVLNNVILIKSFYERDDGIIELKSAYNGYEPIIVDEIDDRLQILGVVRAVLNYF